MADQVTLPEGQESFKLNEVCKLASVQPYMLRFWGTEFEQLEASKSGTGQRLYTRDQVFLVLEIRRLLFDEGLTIAGARKRVNTLQKDSELPKPKKKTAAPTPKKKTTRAAKSKEPEKPEESQEQPEDEPEEPEPEVDKEAPGDVQPLLATLKDVRKEVAAIVAELTE